MAMFDNYPSPEGYIPDNTTETLPEPEPIPDTLPRNEYNVEGDWIGYSWRQGDTLTIEYEVDEYIADEMVGKTVQVDILDHQRKLVDSMTLNGAKTLSIVITNEISEKMIRGNYYFTFKIYNDDTTYISKEFLVVVK